MNLGRSLWPRNRDFGVIVWTTMLAVSTGVVLNEATKHTPLTGGYDVKDSGSARLRHHHY